MYLKDINLYNVFRLKHSKKQKVMIAKMIKNNLKINYILLPIH